MKKIDMTGWNMWEHGVPNSTIKVIKYDHSDSKKTYWLCTCKNHPNTLEIKNGYQLRTGETKNCSCCKLIHNKHDLLNQTFGKLTIIEKTDEKSSNGEIIWKAQCSCGNFRYLRTSGFLSDNITCCEQCSKKGSKGEKLIQKILNENNISFELEKQFNSCRFLDTNRMARFDFYVNNQYIIEFDGEQHQKFTPFFGDEISFKHLQEHDKIKNEWCKRNNIPLIRIPYNHLDNLCLNDLLLETSKFIIK